MTAEAIPGILITLWMIFVTGLMLVQRKVIAQRKLRWILSIWILPAFAVADLVKSSHEGCSPTKRFVLVAASFVVTFVAWLALFQLIGYSVMFRQPVVIEYVLMFAPGIAALLVWKMARRVKADPQSARSKSAH